MSAELAFEEVSRTFHTSKRAVDALRDVSMSIPAGSFTAVVGASGCGKSTLLNIAAGLDSQYTGRFACRPADAGVAYLFQQPRLLPWLNARRNVALVLESHGMSKREARARADATLVLVGLEGFEDHYPGLLSGGMQQRVSLARALVVDPAVMLMDEPFSALDELTARRLRGELVALYEAAPRTVLFVTHNILEASFLADRVVVMGTSPGRIVGEVHIDMSRPRDIDDPALAIHAKRVTVLIGEDGAEKEET